MPRNGRDEHRSIRRAAMTQRILILDYGSQFTQLIARRVREARVYSEIHPPTVSLDFVRAFEPAGIILSGGPASVYGENVPTAEHGLLDIAPVLGICYGMNLIVQLEGGEVKPASRREYGRAELIVDEPSGLFDGFSAAEGMTVWMSHGDYVERPPPSYHVVGHSANSPIAAIRHPTRPIYGLQFHPEVAHTPRGSELIANFLFRVCGVQPTWTPGAFVDQSVERIRTTAGGSRVICGLSGGVDSAVAAALVHRALGDQLTCIFVDTGLLRLNEREQVERTFRANLGIDLTTIDASHRFVDALAGVADPE